MTISMGSGSGRDHHQDHDRTLREDLERQMMQCEYESTTSNGMSGTTGTSYERRTSGSGSIVSDMVSNLTMPTFYSAHQESANGDTELTPEEIAEIAEAQRGYNFNGSNSKILVGAPFGNDNHVPDAPPSKPERCVSVGTSTHSRAFSVSGHSLAQSNAPSNTQSRSSKKSKSSSSKSSSNKSTASNNNNNRDNMDAKSVKSTRRPHEDFVLLVNFKWEGRSKKRELVSDKPRMPSMLDDYMNAGHWQVLLQAAIQLASRNHRVGTLWLCLGVVAFAFGTTFAAYGLMPLEQEQRFAAWHVPVGIGLALVFAGICLGIWGRANRPGGVLFTQDMHALCANASEQVAGLNFQYRSVASEGHESRSWVFGLDVCCNEGEDQTECVSSYPPSSPATSDHNDDVGSEVVEVVYNRVRQTLTGGGSNHSRKENKKDVEAQQDDDDDVASTEGGIHV